jgi:hypothetical protein
LCSLPSLLCIFHIYTPYCTSRVSYMHLFVMRLSLCYSMFVLNMHHIYYLTSYCIPISILYMCYAPVTCLYQPSYSHISFYCTVCLHYCTPKVSCMCYALFSMFIYSLPSLLYTKS